MPRSTPEQRPDILSFEIDDRFRRLDHLAESHAHAVQRLSFEVRSLSGQVDRLTYALARTRALAPAPVLDRRAYIQISAVAGLVALLVVIACLLLVQAGRSSLPLVPGLR